MWAKPYLSWINWQNFIDSSVCNIPRCENVMKQGLNKSTMKQSTSVCYRPHFFLNDSSLEESIACYVSTSQREWPLHLPLQCQSLRFCVAFCGSCNRTWGWADALINTPKKHLLYGLRGRERTLKQQETIWEISFLSRLWYHWSQRIWILSGKADRTPWSCCVLGTLQVLPLIPLQRTQFHFILQVQERISSFHFYSLPEMSHNSVLSDIEPVK